MAGDWIKMRMDLADDPSVISIGRATNIGEDLVVGKLHRLWCWADKHTPDGNAAGVTEEWLDRYIGVPGFAQAMQNSGWLRITDAGISFPNFDRHNGKTAKTRAVTTKRIQRYRSNDASVTKALPEKRREESCSSSGSSGRNGTSFKCLTDVQTKHLDSPGHLCLLHRLANSEHPDLIDDGESVLVEIMAAGLQSKIEGSKPLPLFRWMVSHQAWTKIHGDSRAKARSMLEGHRRWIEQERAAGRQVKPTAIPLPDEMASPA